jgi:hypothetical protein
VFDVKSQTKRQINLSAAETGVYSWGNSFKWLDNDCFVAIFGGRVWLIDLKDSSQQQIFPPR